MGKRAGFSLSQKRRKSEKVMRAVRIKPELVTKMPCKASEKIGKEVRR